MVDPNSLVDYLSSNKQDSSLSARAGLAVQHGLVKTPDEYISMANAGTNGDVNTQLLGKLRATPASNTKEIPGIGTMTVTPKTSLANSGVPVDPAAPVTADAGTYARTGVTDPGTYITPSGAKVDANGKIITAGPTVPGLPQYPTDTPGTTPITDAYNTLMSNITSIEDKIKSNATPSSEEQELAKELADKKAQLAQFDTSLETRVNNLYGQGRGATLGNLGLQETTERRSSALERLGLAQEANTLTTQLGLAQDARKAQGDEATTEYNLASKKLDLVLGVQKEIADMSEKQQDKARQYLLDVVSFAGSKTYDQLDDPTQNAITHAVANSPITLDMVKTSLQNASEKAAANKAGNLRNVAGVGLVQVDPTSGQYTVIAPEQPKAPKETVKPVTDGKLVATADDISKLDQLLIASKTVGAEADGQYVDPNLYEKIYNNWLTSGGTTAGFIKQFPPKYYINPENQTLPTYLRSKIVTPKAASDTGSA